VTRDRVEGRTESRLVRRLVHEPLVHFLLLGALLFALWAAFGRGRDRPEARIVVTRGRVATLVELFERTWQRPPTTQELQSLVDDFVREEIAYREALAMGLDRDDTIVRRRMRQKLEFVVEDLAGATPPTDEELATFLEAHADRFRREPRLTFEHVFLSSRRGDAARDDAARLLAELRGGTTPGALGDPFVLPRRIEGATAAEVSRAFGAEFAATLLSLAPARWGGPVESGYGVHLVRIETREDARLPALLEIREEVAREWSAARRAAANDDFYRRLAERYEVTVEPLAKEEHGMARPGGTQPGGAP
jgi:hypothetical protein